MRTLLTIFFLLTWTTAKDAALPFAGVKPKASFLVAYQLIRSYEGGYANIPNDIGEETYCGISRKFCQDWHGWAHIDAYKRAHGIPEWNYYFNDITEWHVTEFYLDIWVKEGFFDLLNQDVANYLFDFRIHAPLGVKIIQQQLNEYGFAFCLDNKMSARMVEAINQIDSRKFLAAIKARRIDFYKQIADHDPTQRKFLPHWLKRANV